MPLDGLIPPHRTSFYITDVFILIFKSLDTELTSMIIYLILMANMTFSL